MVEKIILVFKTHFDIGFTDLAENVIRKYAGSMLREVIETCRATEHLGKLRYVWTMPAWPLWYITSHCDPELKPELDRLINNGQIVWHALPFTSHTDFCAPEEYAQSLQYARELSEKYNKPYSIAGKMTDVPGHGLMLPEVLDQAGIRFLHLGCNEFATPPAVPPIFFWESPAGGRVLTMYSKGGYGTKLLPPKDWEFPVWMALMHTQDNCGPQSAEIITKMVVKAKAAYPNAEIICGTMDDFYNELSKCDLSSVPVIRSDLADTWIHGVGSYPAEIAQLRQNREQARRLHQAYYKHLIDDGDVISGLAELWAQYYESLSLFEEHTWGADVKTWLGPDRVYEKEEFVEARKTAPYLFMEKSWQEQRDRASACSQILERIAEKLSVKTKATVIAKGNLVTSQIGEKLGVENHRYRVTFNKVSGVIESVYDKKLKTVLLQSQDGIGVFTYQYDRYGFNDINEFLRTYGYRFTTWGIQDYGRENYPDCEHEIFRPIFDEYEIQNNRVVFRYHMDESAKHYGDGQRLSISVILPDADDAFEVELNIEQKQATPFVESGSLILPLPRESEYRIGKPCAVIDPSKQIVSCANHALLNVEQHVTAIQKDACLAICPKDTPLVAIGGTGVYDYQREFPQDRAPQLWFNLFNNMWGTNFPQWIEGSFCYRYTLWGVAPEEVFDVPAKAAAAMLGTSEQLPGVPNGMSLVYTQVRDNALYITLRDHSGMVADKLLRLPGWQIQPVDLLHRPFEHAQLDELMFKVRPLALHSFALTKAEAGKVQ